MGILFRVGEENVHAVRPKPFRQEHSEDDLQQWSDENPHLLNDGLPMLSLGREIETRHGHSIDNLFLDGNGHLVVAELKRGKTPRDVTAQVLDYGAYASRLGWNDIDALCRTRHGAVLESAYLLCLGYDLVKMPEPEHRLLIVAESYEPSVEDAAAYLINMGVELALLAFSYFELDGAKLFDVRVVLGELPQQSGQIQAAQAPTDSATDGFRNWLAGTLRDQLPKFAEARGIEIMLGRGERYVSFIPVPWPYQLGECSFGIAINTRDVGIYFSYVNDRVPADFHERVEAKVSDTSNPYDVKRLNVAKQWTTLSHSLPQPELGNTEQIEKLLEEIFLLVGEMEPVVRSVERPET